MRVLQRSWVRPLTVVLAGMTAAAGAVMVAPASADRSAIRTQQASEAEPSRLVPRLEDRDRRSGRKRPNATQRDLVAQLGGKVGWNRFGTPHTLVRQDGFLATGLRGASPQKAARTWVEANQALFRLDSTDNLELLTSSRLSGSPGAVVHFRQTYEGMPAAEGGLLTLGLASTSTSEWKLAYVSSSVTGDTRLAAQPKLSARSAWLAAAADAGLDLAEKSVGGKRSDREWTLFDVEGLAQPQRVRRVAVPTPDDGVRPAWETLVVDQRKGQPVAYSSFVDAENGKVLVRRNLVHSSHQTADTFSGTVPQTDGACATDAGPWTIGEGEKVASVVVAAEAVLTANDSVIHLLRDGKVVASQDTGTSPEAVTYDPPDEGRGTYHVRVCDYIDGAAWITPNDYTGQIVFSPLATDAELPYPPKWSVFPATPRLDSDSDSREIWCWESSVGHPPVELSECDRELNNPASRTPWDFSPRTNTPTFTTLGNNAVTAEAWSSPFTPGATGFRPVSAERNYSFPWKNSWKSNKCSTPFVPGKSHDVEAAVSNLFAMHNRMHDWSYHLGFTERHWNAQEANFGTGGTAEHDPVLGNTQAGAASGGFPSYLGRDNANMIPLPDGVAPITNMYLWQPLAGAFYAPCVDGDFDMSVIGHEYGHLIENRMIGKGGGRGGHHAGAMGESFGDFTAAEYLNEYGLVPVDGENPFAVGAYVTGNKQRGIRNYGMNFPRTGDFPAPGSTPRVNPLNLGALGYDITGAQVHADGEIWSATNYDIRQAMVEKYNASYPVGDEDLQRACANGSLPVDECPGNRRWMQLVYDAMLLMPVAPSMLDARDAYLAADMMRFGGANQEELWLAFAKRGMGAGASATNGAAESDTDPAPDFASPKHDNATVTFEAVTAENKKTPVVARIYAGHYEARVSPIAVTGTSESGTNLDQVAKLAPGTYQFVAHAPGYGHQRFEFTVRKGEKRKVTLAMATNVASGSNGASASGDGQDHAELIDDTEATAWDRTGATPDVEGSTVTVDLADGVQTIDRVQVSAMLLAQNRFTALRQFEIWACDGSDTTCAARDDFQKVYTSPADAFPGSAPRPVAPELILRSFDIPKTTATHLQIRVVSNQCTGSSAFQGEQDADPLNGTDCRQGSPGSETVELIGDLPQVLAPRHDEVHIAELQAFLGEGRVKRR